MASHEKLAVGLAILKAKFFNKRTPVFVQFAITNRCNLRCKYCNIPNHETKDLTLQEITTIVDQLAELGTKRMVLLGGEPLMRNDIGVIVRHIKDKGIHCGLTTNGYFLKERLPDINILDSLAISIDGDEKENDYLRGTGSFQRSIDALREAKKTGIPVILSTTIASANVHSLSSILALAKKFECQALINIAYHSNISSRSAKEQLATNEEYRALLKEIIQKKKEGAPILLSEQTYRFLLRWPDYTRDRITGDKKSSPTGSVTCHAGKLFCYIDATGNMYPCALTVGETNALNCVREGVRKAWENCLNLSCHSCCVACFVEYNANFSLNPAALFNTIASYGTHPASRRGNT